MTRIIDPFEQESDVLRDLARRRTVEFRAVMATAAAWAVLASGIAYVLNKRIPLESPATRSASSIPDTAPRSRGERLPVLFTNPFDRSEVFEFPPGTRETEARQAVAQMLLQRARERMGYVQTVQRTASVTPSTRG